MYSCATALASRAASPLQRGPNATFSTTFIHVNSDPCWNTTPRSAPGPVIGRPRIDTSPIVGASKPARMLRSVVFPQPDGPMTQRKSPPATARSMSSSAVMPPAASPKRLTTPRTATSASSACVPVLGWSRDIDRKPPAAGSRSAPCAAGLSLDHLGKEARIDQRLERAGYRVDLVLLLEERRLIAKRLEHARVLVARLAHPARLDHLLRRYAVERGDVGLGHLGRQCQELRHLRDHDVRFLAVERADVGVFLEIGEHQIGMLLLEGVAHHDAVENQGALSLQLARLEQDRAVIRDALVEHRPPDIGDVDVLALPRRHDRIGLHVDELDVGRLQARALQGGERREMHGGVEWRANLAALQILERPDAEA